MKSDTWGGIVARITMDKAKANNIDTSTKEGYAQAEQLAHEELRGTLEPLITKVASGNMNVDMMKEPIYKALRIGERREELYRQRQAENQRIRDELKKGKAPTPNPNAPVPSANDGDGSDDLTDQEK